MLKRNFVRYTLLYLILLCLCIISQVPVLAKIGFEDRVITVYKGETRQLKLKSAKGKVVWKSTDPEILSVDEDGYVTGKKRGTAKVSAVCGDETAWIKINVKWYTVKLAIPYPDKDWHEYQVEWQISQLPAAEAVTVWTIKDFDVDDFDGLILPGGADLDPALYGEPNTNSYGIDAAVDTLQMEVLDAFVEAGKPVLGLCRGCQLLNVYFGGTLRQHIGYNHYNTVWRELDVSDETAFPWYVENSCVMESHHQAVGEVGDGLEVTMTDPSDGVIEAVENADAHIYGIQWHPDLMGEAGKPVFKTFIKICRREALEMRALS